MGAGSPLSFYLTAVSMPLAHALAEGYLLDELRRPKRDSPIGGASYYCKYRSHTYYSKTLDGI